MNCSRQGYHHELFIKTEVNFSVENVPKKGYNTFHLEEKCFICVVLLSFSLKFTFFYADFFVIFKNIVLLENIYQTEKKMQEHINLDRGFTEITSWILI